MSSMVRASWPISAGPAVGMEVAKSPCPSRTAASVSASAGLVTRQPSNTPATSASTANTKAVMMRRHTSVLTARSDSVAEARVSISAMPSPLGENTGKLDAYSPRLSMRCTANRPSVIACECSEVNSLSGVALKAR